MQAPPYINSTLLQSIHKVRHGFFTRQGGTSGGAFGSLNCSLSSGDDLEAIFLNRKTITTCLKMDHLFTLKQVHSNRIVVIDEQSSPDHFIEADGMVTKRQNVCLGALGADCAPVLFADGEAGVIGSAHAGWKGALDGVTDSVIDSMCQMGAKRDRILCAIGPAIQWPSYEVGASFRDSLIMNSPISAESFFHADPKTQNMHFDLPGYIHARIVNAGVSQVDQLMEDTYTDRDRFFSYRRNCHENEAQYGRQIGVIGLI